MKPLAHSISAAAAEYVRERPSAPSADVGRNSAVRVVFGGMHGAYGAAWLDKWRTGVLDENGRDRGVHNAMVLWAGAIAGMSDEIIARALVAVVDPRRRASYQFPPSLPEFVSICESFAPVREQARAISHQLTADDRRAARDRLAAIREATLVETRGPLERLHDCIATAYRDAGGTLEDLTTWQMIRR